MNKNFDITTLQEIFEQIYVINLRERKDRRIEISQQLEKLGLSLDDPLVHLFPAVRPTTRGDFPSIGARGCFMSHLGVLEHAIKANYSCILILEDDVDWTKVVLSQNTELASPLINTQWNFLHGGMGDDKLHAEAFILRNVEPEQVLRLTHFIGLRGAKTLSTAHRYLSDILTRPAGSPDGGPMHVDGAYSWLRKENKEIQSYICVPSIAMQRPSTSDITPHTGYKALPLVRYFLAIIRKIRKAVRN